MKLTEILTSQVTTVEPDTSLRDAAAVMADLRLGALPVYDGHTFHGMLTDRDITCRAVARGLDPTRTAVREVMTGHVVCVREDDPVVHAASLMKGHRIRRVVVLDAEGRLAGIVSLADLARRGGSEALAFEVLHDVTEPMTEPSLPTGRPASARTKMPEPEEGRGSARSRDEIRTLTRLHPQGSSCHVAVRPGPDDGATHPATAFEAAVRLPQQSVEPAWRRALEREQARIRRWLEGRRPNGRGIVFFASKPLGLWEVRTLAFPMPTLVVVDTAPYTALLTQALDEGEATMVVHVEKDAAWIWLSEQGDVEAVPHRAPMLEELLRLNADRPIRRLVVGGAEPTLSAFVRSLPEPLHSRLVGTFPVDARQDTDEEVLSRGQQVAQDAERASEKRLVGDAEASPGGRGGTARLHAQRPVEGRVRTLLVCGRQAEGAARPNW
jgi:CBS domain-containing protein